MHAIPIRLRANARMNQKSVAELFRSVALVGALAGFSTVTALAAPVCANSGFCTGTELATGASFSENGFTFSNFDFSAGLGSLEFHLLPGSHVGTGVIQRWANSGFYVTGAGGGNFLDQTFAPGSSFDIFFNYRVSAPVDANYAVVFDRALLGTTGMDYSGHNGALVSAYEDVSGLQAINLYNLIDGPPGATGTADLGQFSRVGLDVGSVISGTVFADTGGDSHLVIGKLVETFDAKTVPEPGTLLLIGIAALGLVGRRRRLIGNP